MDETVAPADPYAVLLKELRGPVASIESYVRTLISRDDDLTASARATIHQVILQQAQRLDVFVDDVVLYVRLVRGELATTTEPVLVAGVVEEVRQALGEPDRVEVTGAEAAIAHTDRSALTGALRRLVRNALVYGPRHGTVRVEVTTTGGEVRVVVGDRGIGIPGDQVEAALRPFTHAVHPDEKRRDGVGLGLAIAAELVRLVGGELLLSDRDPGLTAAVVLPV